MRRHGHATQVQRSQWRRGGGRDAVGVDQLRRALQVRQGGQIFGGARGMDQDPVQLQRAGGQRRGDGDGQPRRVGAIDRMGTGEDAMGLQRAGQVLGGGVGAASSVVPSAVVRNSIFVRPRERRFRPATLAISAHPSRRP